MTVLQEDEVVPEGAHVMKVMGGTGDTKHIWNPANSDEVDAVETLFCELVEDKKYLAYKVDENGEKAEVIRKFDPNIGAMILSPQLVGG